MYCVFHSGRIIPRFFGKGSTETVGFGLEYTQKLLPLSLSILFVSAFLLVCSPCLYACDYILTVVVAP
jgi:hypothetical protein